MKDKQTIGQWLKWDFEANGFLEIRNKDNELIYVEDSDVFWAKWERDSEGKVMYYEDSNGQITDNCTPEIIEHNGRKYQLIR